MLKVMWSGNMPSELELLTLEGIFWLTVKYCSTSSAIISRLMELAEKMEEVGAATVPAALVILATSL